MGQTKRIRAISLMKNILYFSVGLIGAIYIYYKADFRSEPHLICLLGILIILTCCALNCLAHTVYLTEYGVECYRVGKEYRKLPWKQIAQISIVRDLRWSASVSNVPRIIITPIGCEKYSKDWLGLEYLFVFRHQVIWIDYTKENLNFIKRYYSDITDYVYGDIGKNT